MYDTRVYQEGDHVVTQADNGMLRWWVVGHRGDLILIAPTPEQVRQR